MNQRAGTIKKKLTGLPESAVAPVTWHARWWGKSLLLLLTVALLTLSFAPFNQFYLAFVALVPWLIVVHSCRSAWSAFFWSWIGGLGFFIANMWWLAYVTGPGMVALMALLGLYWAVAGAIIHGARLLWPGYFWRDPEGDNALPCARRTLVSVFLIAGVWTALEWFRGSWPLGGLAWLFLGHTQSPFLVMCQIADVTGVYGISFWLILINACIALLILNRAHPRRLIPAGIATGVILLGVLGYGIFRFSQHTTRPGPVVLVVQPDYPQSNTGQKGADFPEIVDFHIRTTQAALAAHPGVNLVVWSETMMPALDPEATESARLIPSPYWRNEAELMAQTRQQLAELAHQDHTSVLTGGVYYADFRTQSLPGNRLIDLPYDRRNAAYFFTPAGQSTLRYDKIHLVPFGEYLPFKSAIPPLYRLFLSMSPYTEEFTLTPGADDALTVFKLPPEGWRFVTPICFEDIVADLTRLMFKPGPDGRKRADFIVNITNDGWFRYNEMPQHLQAAAFRSIENRVPTARSVNTGISGFIDSLGRPYALVPAGQTGTSVAMLSLDSRVTFYTRFGDVFAYICVAMTIGMLALAVLRWARQRGKKQKV